MKKWKKIAVVVLACLLVGSMTACGNKGLSENAIADTYQAGGTYASDEGWAMEAAKSTEEAAYSEEKTANVSLLESDQQNLTHEDSEESDRKLIRNMSLSLETTAFDELQSIIEQKVKELGGYIENSTMDGTANSSNRYSYLTVRIPVDQLDTFEQTLGNSATVLSKSSNVQDVTLSYSDLAAHISSLRIEQETLMEMLSKADSVDTIITIQNELTNVRYELESYESQMKILENQISYSTVNINIREVKIPSVQEKEGFISRVKHTFFNSVSDLGEGIEDFLVFFFGNIIGIILFLAIAFGVLWLIRAIFRFLFGRGRREKAERIPRKSRRKKREEQKGEEEQKKGAEVNTPDEATSESVEIPEAVEMKKDKE